MTRSFVVASLLVCAAATSAFAQDTTASLLERAAHDYRTARTIRAAFDQTLTSPGTGATHPARGEYFQGGAGKFALRFGDPGGDAIVSDGTWIWLYLPSSAKGQVLKMPAAVGNGLDFLSALLTAPTVNYAVARGPDEVVDGHAAESFSLTPRRADMPFTHATLWIGKSDALIWRLETTEPSGLVRHVAFTEIHMNVALPADALSFTVPAGVRVIDQDALFGKKKPD